MKIKRNKNLKKEEKIERLEDNEKEDAKKQNEENKAKDSRIKNEMKKNYKETVREITAMKRNWKARESVELSP